MVNKINACVRRNKKDLNATASLKTKKRKKQEVPERMRTMQGVRAILAVRKLARMTNQTYKTKTVTRRLWWRGWRTTMITSVVLLRRRIHK